MDTGHGVARQWLRQLLRNKMLLLMLGGAIGTYLRYLVGTWFKSHPWGQVFPFGTLFINVTGSFLLGLAAALFATRLLPEHEDWFLLIGVGFCGGYTTFSTFELETYNLVRDGSWGLAFANITGSVVAGFVGVLLGVALVGILFPRQ